MFTCRDVKQEICQAAVQEGANYPSQISIFGYLRVINDGIAVSATAEIAGNFSRELAILRAEKLTG
jgi:hypothetical protein